jgi:hypothetical protein
MPSSKFLDEAILALRAADGGWPYRRGGASRVEPTALVALALAPGSDRAGAARAWLLNAQRPDGAFDAAAGADLAAWPTPLAMLALGTGAEAGAQSARARAEAFLLADRPAVILDPGAIRVSGTLRGWSWTRDAFSWVEPTAYALLALKKSPAGRRDPAVAKRVDEAERMLWDRMCEGGGWNFGNPAAFGYPIRPFPVPTAVAVIALQDHRDDPRARASLDTLRRIAPAEPSVLGLAWALACCRILGADAGDLQARLEARLASRDGPAPDVPSLAAAAIALGGAAPLEVPRP